MPRDRELASIIIGAGGHAGVLLCALRQLGVTPAGCIALEAPSSARWPMDVPYLGGHAVLEQLPPESHMLINGLGSSGAIRHRQAVFENARAAGFRFRGIVHPSAIIADDAEIDETALIMAGAVVQSGARIGANVLINTGAIVDHDCRVGAHSHVATGARLAGEVTVEEGVHIGAGATVIQQRHIGLGAVIAAGAVVIASVPPGALQGGVPAKPLRRRSS